ncbi:MAG: glycosyltransferase [Crocinitomicaceae bacterium]
MIATKKILVSVTNDLVTDQRVHKVCTFLSENGFEVVLIGRKRKHSLSMEKRTYSTKRMRLLFDKGVAFYVEYTIRLFFVLISKKCTHILSNDLDTLLPSYVAKKLKRKCTLIYDSHEYFTEVPELIAHPTKKKIWERVEKFIFPKLKKVYTVNESIAEKYRSKYHVEVDVVRNLAPKWYPVDIKSKEELGIPANKKLIIAQGAGINVDRGIEEAVQAMKYTENMFLMIVGDGDVVEQLKQTVLDDNLTDKVGFYSKRPYQEMMEYTYYADLGLTLDKDTNLNYRFSLPNKVFDYIQAKTPILASDLVEVKKVVLDNKVGAIITSHDPKDLAKDFEEILSNEEELNELKKNCEETAQRLSWENELQTLKKIYEIS